jgi:predicted RNase H-like HicB family nuclease
LDHRQARASRSPYELEYGQSQFPTDGANAGHQVPESPQKAPKKARAPHAAQKGAVTVVGHGGRSYYNSTEEPPAMPLTVELIPDPELGGFTARLPDIPAYGEGRTEEQAITDLREAIRGYIEAFGLEDALARLSSPSVRQVEWDLAELARG